ncbi:YraN family protein [Mycetocola spongiae]|uniref:YraN family protein n=1 Tax=Mycetocola spongiae TaxID=2859226 RepID=UPI001CF5856A|nr:YraN family protein [Mycetocola spongiae]UCR89206.1 YraN family protein [Mycetocola spongiae]
MHNSEWGELGEAIAVSFLRRRHFRILARNWRCRFGEVDIIARDPRGVIAVVEVKTRRSLVAGHPAEAVTARKLARLEVLAGEWRRVQRAAQPPLRIDVVSVLLSPRDPPQIEHFRGVQP